MPKIVAIGNQTKQTIIKQGYSVDFLSSTSEKGSMIEEFLNIYGNKKLNIFYPKSNLAEDLIFSKEYAVTNCICYENIPKIDTSEKLDQIIETEEVTSVYFASPSAAKRFFKYTLQNDNLEYISIGKTTQKFLGRFGIKSVLKNSI